MRLTLRNLLAYMDDLLDPESARIIGQKTEESQFASGLLHRIRDVTRRVKLGAPEVIDRKAALDPNTVAEYLDNTLSADQVTDFEKACLDSDVELAEVAACHQILTLVLGEPAEVRPESRTRMYHLPETAASHTYVETDKTAEAGETQRIDTPSPPPVRRRQPAIPEYLLEARRRRRRLFWMTAAGLVFCLAVYLGVEGPGGRFFGSDGGSSSAGNQVALAPQPPANTVAVPPPLQDTSPADPPAAKPEPAPEPSSVAPPSPAPAPNPPAGSDPAPGPVAPVAAEPTTDAVVPVTPTPVPPPAADAAETPTAIAPLSPSDASPGPAPAPAPGPEQVAATSVPLGVPNDQEPMISQPPVPEAPTEGREIARLVLADEILLVSDEKQPFKRVAISEPLRTGQCVVSLPTWRPVIRIDGKFDVEMVDGGETHFLHSEAGAPAALEIAWGRMVLQPTEQAGAASLALRVGGVSGLLSLADATTLVAIDVGRTDDPIQDPSTHPAPVTARLWGVGTSGKFSWTPDGGAEIALQSPMMLDLMAVPAGTPAPQETPEWVKDDLTDKIARQASGILYRSFDYEPADLILRENADHRRREVRHLVRQSLSWIGDFGPVVEVLDRPEQYAEWPELIDLLRQSVRRGPKSAEAVREALNVKYGPRGEELYELLWKFDSKELPAEAARQLVQYLDDPLLPSRVLAFQNLNRITGKGYYYRPEENEVERKASIQRWNGWAERIPGAQTPESSTTPADDPLKQLLPGEPLQ